MLDSIRVTATTASCTVTSSLYINLAWAEDIRADGYSEYVVTNKEERDIARYTDSRSG